MTLTTYLKDDTEVKIFVDIKDIEKGCPGEYSALPENCYEGTDDVLDYDLYIVDGNDTRPVPEELGYLYEDLYDDIYKKHVGGE